MSYKEMLNLLEQKKEEILLLNKNISKLEDECEELHEKVVKNFIKNFSNSDEEIVFMLKKENIDYDMMGFIKKYLEKLYLYSNFDTYNKGQLVIGIALPYLSEKELKISSKNLERLIPLMKNKDVCLIEVIVDKTCFKNRLKIYLEIKDKEYRILLKDDYLRVYVDWSRDLYDVLSKGRLIFRSYNKKFFEKLEEV